jgi:hypothetical protein
MLLLVMLLLLVVLHHLLLQEPAEVIDPLVTLKLLDASAAAAAARQVVRAGPALHDGLMAEATLKDARLRALAAAQDSTMVSICAWGGE